MASTRTYPISSASVTIVFRTGLYFLQRRQSNPYIIAFMETFREGKYCLHPVLPSFTTIAKQWLELVIVGIS